MRERYREINLGRVKIKIEENAHPVTVEGVRAAVEACQIEGPQGPYSQLQLRRVDIIKKHGKRKGSSRLKRKVRVVGQAFPDERRIKINGRSIDSTARRIKSECGLPWVTLNLCRLVVATQTTVHEIHHIENPEETPGRDAEKAAEEYGREITHALYGIALR